MATAYSYRGLGAISDADKLALSSVLSDVEDQLAAVNVVVGDGQASGAFSQAYATSISQRISDLEDVIGDLYGAITVANTATEIAQIQAQTRDAQAQAVALRQEVSGSGLLGGSNLKKVALWGALAVGAAVGAGLLVAHYGSAKKRRRRR